MLIYNQENTEKKGIMNSNELRNLSQKSQEEQMQRKKDKLYNDYHELMQKSHIFVERNSDKFIEYIEE